MGRGEQTLRALDRWQQRHTFPAFVVGVVKKFGDDNAGVLAANLAFSAFGAVFPLLLLLITVLGLVLAGDPGLRDQVLNSALRDFPVIGGSLGSNIHALKARSVPALAVSIAALTWSSMGLSQTGLFSMAQVWNLPGPERPDFVHRLLRGFGFLAVMGLGLIITTGLASFGTIGSGNTGVATAAEILAVLANIGVYVLAFRVLTPRSVRTRQLWPGAILGGVLWTVLQALGGYLVQHELRGSSQVYGTFAVVLGLMAWIFLGVRISLYAAEINTVLAGRMWPRSLVLPPLTVADRRSLALQAQENQRLPEQKVTVSFEQTVSAASTGMSARSD